MIRFVHWNEEEALERSRRLTKMGFEVDGRVPEPSTFRREIREKPPSAIVIDLSRLPAQGRDFALALRETRSTRAVPIVFLEGEPEKTKRIRELLPDATFTSWKGAAADLKRVIRKGPLENAVASDRMAAFRATPLARKLGVGPGFAVSLVGAPVGFEKDLGSLPEGAVLKRRAGAGSDLTVWFVRTRRDLEARVERMARFAEGGRLWIVWPKQGSPRAASDLNQVVVRRAAERAGLVDFRIAKIDETWSGLRFSRR